MISVLMPTRGRPSHAEEALASLGDVERCVWIDSDQEEMYRDLRVDQRIVLPRVGYRNMHVMVNALAAEATGDWLMLWNDDARMLTEDWQAKLEGIRTDRPICVAPGTWQGMNLFPLISRGWYETTGHFSQDPHCDSWAMDVANIVGIHHILEGVEVAHLRDEMRDDTWAESQGSYSVTSPGYFTPEKDELRLAEAAKLTEALQ